MVVKVNIVSANKLDHLRYAYVTLIVLKKMMDFTKVAQFSPTLWEQRGWAMAIISTCALLRSTNKCLRSSVALCLSAADSHRPLASVTFTGLAIVMDFHCPVKISNVLGCAPAFKI